MTCTACPLHASARNICIPGEGPANAEILIVVESPGQWEDYENRPIVGPTYTLLGKMLAAEGINIDNCRIENSVRCRSQKPKTSEIKACRRHLKIKAKYVLTLGATALKSVLNQTGITEKRGRPQTTDNSIIFPTINPAAILRDERYRVIVREDLKQFAKIVKSGKIPQETKINPILVRTKQQFAQMLAAMRGVISLDLETSDLYPWAKDAHVTIIGIGTRDAQWIIAPGYPWTPAQMQDIVEALAERAEHTFIVTQNGKFDVLWLRVHYGWTPTIDFDTLLAHYLIDENQPHDLEFLANLYLGAPSWDIPTQDKQKITASNIDKAVRYNALDLFYTRNLFHPLNDRLRSDARVAAVFDHILIPLTNLTVRMEHEGAYINLSGMSEARRYLDNEIATREATLRQYGDIKWSSPKQIAKLLFDDFGITPPLLTKKGAPSTAEAALVQIDHPLVGDLLLYRGAKQQKSFFIDGWEPWIVNSRLHPSIKLHGTVSSRPAYEHPNIQQCSRDPRIRSLICAPPGDYELMEFDLSQIELRIAAELSQDSTMLQCFRDGIDLHWRTGCNELQRMSGNPDIVLATAKALGVSTADYNKAMHAIMKAGPGAAAKINPFWKDIRQKAKAVNFGFLYGMFPKKFRLYAKTNYGIDITLRDATNSRQAFFNLYLDLLDWHERQKQYARSRGFVRSIDGQKRRLPAIHSEDNYLRMEAERMSINAPVQGFASKILLMILLQMTEEFSWSVFRPFATVHDAILAYVRKSHISSVGGRLLEITKKPCLFSTLDIEFSVPLDGEIKLGPWGSGVPFQK